MNKTFRKYIFRAKDLLLPKVTGEAACELIRKELLSERPIMIARFGAVERKAVLYSILPPVKYLLTNYVYKHLHTNAGFFPVSDETIDKFGKLMIESMKQVDILASWRPEELIFRRNLVQSKRISLGDLGPTVNECYSWSSALNGKRILVIHPFAKSIERQYNENRKKLFDNPDILPEFKSLQTITAVQTIAGDTAGFSSWFEALEYMEN